MTTAYTTNARDAETHALRLRTQSAMKRSSDEVTGKSPTMRDSLELVDFLTSLQNIITLIYRRQLFCLVTIYLSPSVC